MQLWETCDDQVRQLGLRERPLQPKLSDNGKKNVSIRGKQCPIKEKVMTDEEMVAKLVELAAYYAEGGLSNNNPTLVAEVMKVGRTLDRSGGINEMRRIFNMIPPMQGKRTVEMQWEGIGDWRG